MTSTSEQITARFEPINQAHAIVETVFFCEFAPPLNPSLLTRLLELEHDAFLKEELPEFKTLKHITVGFKLDKDSETQSAVQLVEPQDAGFERKKLNQEEGTLEWLLKVTSESLSVHCLDYSRWAEEWDKAKKILYRVLNKFGTTESSISAVGLKCIDRFVYDGDVHSDYKQNLLFNECSQLLHPKAFSSGPRWHCHIGWFEEIPHFQSEYECLNQLNIDAVFTNISEERKHVTTIEHNLVVRGVANDLPTFIGAIESESAPLNRLMQHLHRSNKKVIANLLTDEMKQRISLRVEDDTNV